MKWLEKKLDALVEDMGKEAVAEGETSTDQQGTSKGEEFGFRSVDKDSLLRFAELAIFVAPEFDIGLTGFELGAAVLAGLPGFVVEHLPWNPVHLF